ncbi:hypothetical protein [Vibrio sp. MEBiC08052]|uniref:hypothetical protein n=1 Tax=Vibrio sp. MEBiC08052 TaxID=1761910 RepID=UPI0007407BD6|nr:hypothetical protein [Vibrio sp. MEBiC08052]KUJ00060.1 hypothetical protein VRK_07720 [Vibrio sp. MEBiC08052]
MSSVNVLVAVNVEQALVQAASGNTNIGNFVYMVDSTGYCSSGQGGHELTTTVTSGETIVWTVQSIDPSTEVTIIGFEGNAIGTPGGSHIINPMQYPQFSGSVWGGQVYAASSGPDQYSIRLLLGGGVHCWFDPFIISNAPANQ